MSDQSKRFKKVAIMAALLWLTIPVAWSTAMVLDRTRAWESSPQQAWMVGWAALVAAGALTLWTIVRATDRSRVSGRVFASGLVAFGLGLAASVVVAWALPVWMVLFGVGLLLFAPGMGSLRRVTQVTGAAMLAGVAFQIVLSLMKLGTPDSYGDYPIAWTVATFVATVGAAAGLSAMSHLGGRTADKGSVIAA